ncbi:hypothetical protein A7982_13824 [Minicystis rosea]|nr:hypothetical protein A7982_13824 [Minicystis rosea]
MPLELPNLDDHTYADLVDEGRASLPALYPAWTDHNPSEPGITLLELFAWLSEAVLYRTNQIPDATYDSFLGILNGPGWTRPKGQTLDEAIYQTMSALREPFRAITREDYERLVKEEWSAVARVHCLPERQLDPYVGTIRMPGHVSVIIMPSPADPAAPWDQPNQALRDSVRSFLNHRRLLTTRLHIVGPFFSAVPITATLYLSEDADPNTVVANAQAVLRAHFHPFTGGADGQGWPLGRAVYVSHVYAVLEGVSGVEIVKDVDLPVASSDRRILNDDGELVGVTLLEHELPMVQLDSNSISTMERRGDEWLP